MELNVHVEELSSTKSHSCNECGKSFSRKSNLLRHEKIHINEKLYECVKCGKSFSRKFNLLRHEKIHINEKLYKCEKCEQGFNTKCSFNQHMKTHDESSTEVKTDCGDNQCRRNNKNTLGVIIIKEIFPSAEGRSDLNKFLSEITPELKSELLAQMNNTMSLIWYLNVEVMSCIREKDEPEIHIRSHVLTDPTEVFLEDQLNAAKSEILSSIKDFTQQGWITININKLDLFIVKYH